VRAFFAISSRKLSIFPTNLVISLSLSAYGSDFPGSFAFGAPSSSSKIFCARAIVAFNTSTPAAPSGPSLRNGLAGACGAK
jgi:hypothetical protein